MKLQSVKRLACLIVLLVQQYNSSGQTSSLTDYFRSKSSGQWNATSTWETSNDGTTNWIASTSVPTEAANMINIRSGHTVIINTNTTVDQVIVSNGGVLELATNASTLLTVNDGVGNDIIIQNGGTFKHNITGAALPAFNSSATMEIQAGGILEVANNNGSPSNYAVTTSAIAGNIIWNDNSIFNWNNTAPAANSVTYFPSSAAIPVFRFSSAASIGGGNATVINGLLEANANVDLLGSGTKTFRNGIAGSATVSATAASVGQFIINGATAKLGGGTLALPDNGLLISATVCTVTSNKTINKVTANSSNTTGLVTLSGTLIASDFVIDGSTTILINGTVKTSNPNGFYAGTNTTFAKNFAISFFGAASIIEYNRLGDQVVSALSYSNLSISGSGTKRVTAASDIVVTGILDIAPSSTFALNGTNNLKLNGSSTLNINANGTFDNGGESKITGGSFVNVYGIFITRSATGFTGSTSATIPGATSGSSPAISLAIYDSSTIEYGRAGDQQVTSRSDYSNITFSGSGIKTIPTMTPKGIVTIKDNAIADASNKTFGDTTNTLIMTGGRFRVGGQSTKPDIGGTYFLTGGVIEFSGGTVASRENIRSSPTYLNIEVSGINVGNSNSSTKLANGGTFTVKTGGSYENSSDKIDGSTGTQTFVMEAGSTFKTGVVAGFSGTGTEALSSIETIAIDPKSTIIYSRSTSQTITMLPSGYPTLLLKGGGIKTVSNGTVLIAATADSVVIDPLVTLKVSGGAKVDFNNRQVIVHSNAIGTGFIGEITDNSAALLNAGNVTLERYIPAKRAFRFLSSAVTTSTSIKTNWMEGQSNPPPAYSVNYNGIPGYGTHITGSADPNDGFDATATNNPSLFMFSNVKQAWDPANNTNSTIAAGVGYRLLVRGSRSVNLSNNSATPSSTILRTTGILKAGSVVYNQASIPGISGNNSSYSLLGNPYASPVDWNALQKPGLSAYYTVWDPTLNVRGAFATYGNGTTNPASSQINQHIQPGQAFFVQTTAANPSLTFNEANKTTTARSVFRETGAITNLAVQLLTDTTGDANNTADGVNVIFDDSFTASVAAEDAKKLTNLDENMSVDREGSHLCIEGRPNVMQHDTIPLYITQYRQNNYYLKIEANNLSNKLTAVLKDSYLNTEIPLDLSSPALTAFSITADSASSVPNRFMIILKNSMTLPLTLIDIKAFKKGAGIQAQWIVDNETGIEWYEVEKSAKGHQFEKKAVVAVKTTSALRQNYSWYDENVTAGDNFYRIKYTDKTGGVKYSNQAVVNIDEGKRLLLIFPNPVKDNTINLSATNLEKGIYSTVIYNAAGKMVYAGVIRQEAGMKTHKIVIEEALNKGIYTLKISNTKDTLATTILFE